MRHSFLLAAVPTGELLFYIIIYGLIVLVLVKLFQAMLTSSEERNKLVVLRSYYQDNHLSIGDKIFEIKGYGDPITLRELISMHGIEHLIEQGVISKKEGEEFHEPSDYYSGDHWIESF
jgi:hypothetical protein